MKQKKLMIAIVSILVLLTAVLAAVHLNTRDTVPEGAIMVRESGQTEYVRLDKLALTDVVGTTVNGKGQEKEIDAKGIALSEMITAEEYEEVTVSADDEYSAEVGADEIDNAFLILGDDGAARLVVFGDTNAKRDVKNVVRIDVE